jgi:hypothetical protein
MSPRVQIIRDSDATVNQFLLSDITKEDAALLGPLLDLARNQAIGINDGNIESLYRLSGSLGNSELTAAMFDFHFRGESLSLSNAIERIGQKRRLGLERNVDSEFLAKNLFRFSRDQLLRLAAEVSKPISG